MLELPSANSMRPVSAQDRRRPPMLPLRAHDLLLRYIRSFSDTKRSLHSAIGRVKLTCLSTI